MVGSHSRQLNLHYNEILLTTMMVLLCHFITAQWKVQLNVCKKMYQVLLTWFKCFETLSFGNISWHKNTWYKDFTTKISFFSLLIFLNQYAKFLCSTRYLSNRYFELWQDFFLLWFPSWENQWNDSSLRIVSLNSAPQPAILLCKYYLPFSWFCLHNLLSSLNISLPTLAKSRKCKNLSKQDLETKTPFQVIK